MGTTPLRFPVAALILLSHPAGRALELSMTNRVAEVLYWCIEWMIVVLFMAGIVLLKRCGS